MDVCDPMTSLPLAKVLLLIFIEREEYYDKTLESRSQLFYRDVNTMELNKILGVDLDNAVVVSVAKPKGRS